MVQPDEFHGDDSLEMFSQNFKRQRVKRNTVTGRDEEVLATSYEQRPFSPENSSTKTDCRPSRSDLGGLVSMHDRRPQSSSSLLPEKAAYFWRDSLSGYENVDSYIDDDQQLRQNCPYTH